MICETVKRDSKNPHLPQTFGWLVNRHMHYVTLNALLLVSLVVGCDFPRRPEAVTISDPVEIRPDKPSDVMSPADAISAIMTICRKDLNLPTPDSVRLSLYRNSASFASYGQGWSNLPIDVDNITAFTRRGEIHLDLGKTRGKRWGNLIDILAHEYGHAIHYSLGNRPTTRWFDEGFAGWVAARVLHSLGGKITMLH